MNEYGRARAAESSRAVGAGRERTLTIHNLQALPFVSSSTSHVTAADRKHNRRPADDGNDAAVDDVITLDLVEKGLGSVSVSGSLGLRSQRTQRGQLTSVHSTRT